MRLLINAISAKRGGALTYLQNVLPHLRDRMRGRQDHITVWRGEALTAADKWPSGIEYRQDTDAGGGSKAIGGNLSRIWFDQVKIPKLVKAGRFDALFSTANFGPLRCVHGNVLLVRNTAYFEPIYLNRIRARKVLAYYRVQRWFTIRSMHAASMVLFPSASMCQLVAPYFGGVRDNWKVVHYGIAHNQFYRCESVDRLSLPTKLLNVSLYSDQKNFGTLFIAIDLLNRYRDRAVHLTMTAGFDREWQAESDFFPNFSKERTLFRQLQIAGLVTDLGWQKHSEVAELYRQATIFVFPSYTESFGHPLVEAMAAGLPIIAADTPVSRELCGDAALYFPPFDAPRLAIAIRDLSNNRMLQSELGSRGRIRAKCFDWSKHVGQLLESFHQAVATPRLDC